MNINKWVQFIPQYEFENITEKQFKALNIKMLDYPKNRESRSAIGYLSYRGGKLIDGTWYFAISLDHIAYDEFFRGCDNLANSYILMRQIVKDMDEVVEELKKVAEEAFEV